VLFNSFTFIFVFVPVVWMGFVLMPVSRHDIANTWICIASLVFYGFSGAVFLVILILSITVNYGLAVLMLNADRRDVQRALLIFGISGNLAVIGYFKYANFFVQNLGTTTIGFELAVAIGLPLGISFFTFQKIAFLVDLYRGVVKEFDLRSYVFFVTFFPQLIAGPIVHYGEIAPQLSKGRRDHKANLTAGGSLFIIGLFKKVVIADSIAFPSNRFFNGVAAGVVPDFANAWVASLCYALQIYFDFSAYSDMALGLGRMFGINLPVNFASPYKASSIIEFWRRWHITLSRLLRDYLYIPLGGGRRGTSRRAVNLMLTMLIGGLWHGAAWAYVAWGGLHGLFLLVNHAWEQTALSGRLAKFGAWRFIAHALTLACVVFAWVPFRIGDLGMAVNIWMAMLGIGAGKPMVWTMVGPRGVVAAVILMAAAIILPNALEIMVRIGTATPGYPASEIRSSWLRWAPSLRWAIILGSAFGAALVKMNDASDFIYFHF
jgi:D-alanyl-lipoteichoic acid acyltransferase DltB (MBOAT superfamily)